MLTTNLVSLFERDLTKLIAELALYKNEADIWRTEKEIANSAGNLTLHLIGNLNAYIGAEIGKQDISEIEHLNFPKRMLPDKC